MDETHNFFVWWNFTGSSTSKCSEHVPPSEVSVKLPLPAWFTFCLSVEIANG